VENEVVGDINNESEDNSNGCEGGGICVTKDIPSDVMAKLIEELESDGDNADKDENEEKNESLSVDEITIEEDLIFAAGDPSKAFSEFKDMLRP
jgi:hypothetical protein